METIEATVIALNPHRIDTELEKANVTRAILNKLRTSAEPLLGKAITTDAEFDRVHEVEQACVKVRNVALAICKKERDPAIAYQRAVIAKEKEVVSEIEEIEAPLKKLKADYKAIAQKRMEEDAARYAAKMKARKDRMYEIGFRFDGNAYVMEGFASLTEEEVTGAEVNELQLGEWLNDIERQVTEHKEREAEAARTAKIAADALAAQQKAEAERQATVAAEQARKEKELADKEAAMNARVQQARMNELIAIGDTTSHNLNLHILTDEQFAELKKEVIKDVAVARKVQEEAAQKAEVERKANEERIAAEAVKRAEAQRIADEAREKEEAAEREAKMTDAAKFRAYHAALMAVKAPEMKSKAGQKRIAEVLAQLGSLLKA